MWQLFPRAKQLTGALLVAHLLLAGCVFEPSETIEVPTSEESQRLTGPLPRSKTPRISAAKPVREQDQEQQPIISAGMNQRLNSWFSVRENYDLVYRDVLKFYPDGRYNGCVAFLSAALRRLGTQVPLSAIDGTAESPSLVTKPFSNYLENSLGWKRIGSAANLQAGDIVFTRDNRSYPGYPAHTYMFHAWSDKSVGVALVIDNQDFTHERNIYSSGGGFNFTPYAYALRAP